MNNKNKLIFIGKWVVIGILASFNFIAYLMNDTYLNLILAIVVFLYSIYEFFQALSMHKIHLGIKMYLFTFYLFGVTSLLMGLRSFLAGNVNYLIMSFLFIAGDVALILYTLHKMQELK